MAWLLFSSKHTPFNNRLCDSICPPARRSCAVSDSGFESVGGLHPGTAELSINMDIVPNPRRATRQPASSAFPVNAEQLYFRLARDQGSKPVDSGIYFILLQPSRERGFTQISSPFCRQPRCSSAANLLRVY